MVKLVKRTVKGNEYYYLEISLRIGRKVRKVYKYLGKEKPSAKLLIREKKKLETSAVNKFYENSIKKFKFSYLSKNELTEIEKVKDAFIARFEKLSQKQKQKYRKEQVVHFVYTSLRTEGIDLNYSDVETAFEIMGNTKNEFTFNNKVIISSSMITGFNFLSKINFKKEDILRLHGIIMSTFENESPGQLRDDQRIIARFNPKTLASEEIRYRPPSPNKISEKLDEFFNWFEENKHIYPLELAALVHLKIYLIHPFKDGNKRMCRLLFNKILEDYGFPIINISKNTSEYFKKLIKSVESGNEIFFVKFCHSEFLKQIKYRRLK